MQRGTRTHRSRAARPWRRGGEDSASPRGAHDANERGAGLARRGLWREALAAFDAAIAAGGADPTLCHNRALARLVLGDANGAVADLDVAWGAGDRRPLVQANRASALLAARRYARAEQACDGAIEAAAPHREIAASLFAQRGVARASQGAIDAALRDFDRAARLTRDGRLRAELDAVRALARTIA